jgi:hypothetical protein
VDQTFAGMLDTAQKAAEGLNFGETAYNSVSETVNGIVKALGDKSAQVKAQVDSIIAQIARLNMAGGYGATTGFGSIVFSGIQTARSLFHSNYNGIDNVPYDGYLALLHQGESVRTAAETELSRRYSNQAPGFDYSAMGSAMWENAPNLGGGNVYLDGQTVGRVISSRQADSYRALERSGWQQ